MRIDQLPVASAIENTDTLPFSDGGTTKQISVGNLTNSIRDNVYGAPLTASTSSDITDTSRIYVYTGTTGGGFTNGHWYYYNGSAWTDGGAYNSAAVQTDATLTLAGVPADAKVVGDDFTAINATLNPLVTNLNSIFGATTDREKSMVYRGNAGALGYTSFADAMLTGYFSFTTSEGSALVDKPSGLASHGICMTFVYGNARYQMVISANKTWIRYIGVSGVAQPWTQLNAVDATLSLTGIAADAAATGEGLAKTLQYGRAYVTNAAFIADVPSQKLGGLPVNRVYAIADSSVNALDEPESNFIGTVITFSYSATLHPGDVQLAIGLKNNFYYRYYVYASGGNYWADWQKMVTTNDLVALGVTPKEYYVGPNESYTSFAGLLYDLRDDETKKVIYIRGGEYDIYAEYVALVSAGKLTVPSDNITSSDYFYPYNVFVPTNTKIVGLGNVVLKMSPTVAQLAELSSGYTGYGASRTWSPLNIYGSVEIENVTVVGHNCRYCLHNDDHGEYDGVKQIYRNCRFLYTLSDSDAQDRRLGFNNTIGFGINNGSTHIFEDCEIYLDTTGNQSAYYGHDSSAGSDGFLILKNCRIHTSNFSSTRGIRLQTLTHNNAGKVTTLFENCYINGRVELTMEYSDTIQSFSVRFVNCNKVPISRVNNAGGTVNDPYTVEWYNPLPTPTSVNPYIETDSAN